MKRFFNFTILILSSFGLFANGPQYASNQTREIIEKMITAHGGMDDWSNSTTFSFDNVMFSQSLPDSPFWVSQTTIEQKSRRVYQEWPLHDASMAYNGKTTWSVDWKVGNPPKFEALFFYYFLNLPWLTQDDNVKLGEVTRTKHKAFKNEVFIINMGFTEKPAVGKTKIDTYKLYIDTESHLLVGYEYTIAYGYMLDLFNFPIDKDFFGPMFRINDSFTNVGKLIYPNRMHTGNTEQTQIYGYHAILNYSLSKEFDEHKMKIPANAVIDKSSYIRANKQ